MMKRSIVVAALISVVLLVAGVNAEAVSVWVDPASQTVGVGDVLTVDIVIDGLGDETAPSLAAWSLDLSYDGGILGTTDVFYGSRLGLNMQMPPQYFMLSTPGETVRLAQSSVMPWSLDTSQPAGFSLARLDLLALSPGSSDLVLSNVFLTSASYDSVGYAIPITDFTTADGHVEVLGGAAPIPEPGTLLLLGAGLAGLGLARRQGRERRN